MFGGSASLRRIYAFSAATTVIVFLVTGIVGGAEALLSVLVLSALEVTFSFDNAVVNAKVLQRMSVFWQKAFMTVGILIAVFGMRLLLPVVLVALTARLPMNEVVQLALERPADYAHYLTLAHPIIASFGGMFLLMIFLEFVLDYGRRVHWIRIVERPFMRIGRLKQVPPLLALIVLVAVTQWLAGAHKFSVLLAGVLGLVAYLSIRAMGEFFEMRQKQQLERAAGRHTLLKASLANFLYLELLDASFSFDGVIGAFAITNMVLLIAAGLGVGAVWVRSMTIHIVRHNTLLKYRYLDHGAHYAIGALAAMLLLGIRYDINQAVTGTIGILIIGFAFYSSWRYNHLNEPVPAHMSGRA